MKYISINPIKHTRTIPATLGFIVNNMHGYATISTTPYNSDILVLIIFTDENAKYTIREHPKILIRRLMDGT